MKFLKYVAAIVAIGFLATPASASVWTAAISYDDIMDVVQDNSVSLALFENGDGIVSAGDIVAGVIKWNTNIADGVPVGNHAITVFAAEVVSNNGAGQPIKGNPSLNFTLTSNVAALSAMLPAIAASVGGFSAGTLGVTLSHVGGTDPTTQGLAAALLNINTNYAIDFEFGFKTASDYFEAELRDHRTIPGGGGLGVLGPDGVISITDSDLDGFADEWDDSAAAGPGASILAGSGQIGAESGGFSVLRDFTGPGPAFYSPLPTAKLDGSAGPGTGETQLVLSNSTTLVQPTTAQAGNGYAFADQSIVALNANPEPTSLMVWGGGLLCSLAFRARRKKNNA